jgi:hypothetical protein
MLKIHSNKYSIRTNSILPLYLGNWIGISVFWFCPYFNCCWKFISHLIFQLEVSHAYVLTLFRCTLLCDVSLHALILWLKL